MKILIVDDSSSDRQILRMVIEQQGLAVVEAANGMTIRSPALYPAALRARKKGNTNAKDPIRQA